MSKAGLLGALDDYSLRILRELSDQRAAELRQKIDDIMREEADAIFAALPEADQEDTLAAAQRSAAKWRQFDRAKRTMSTEDRTLIEPTEENHQAAEKREGSDDT